MPELVSDLHGQREVVTKSGDCPRCHQHIRLLREVKRCPSCGLTRPASDFSHTSRRSDHLDSRCRHCISVKGRAEAHGTALTPNPIEEGVITGSLMEIAVARDGAHGGNYTRLLLEDVQALDRDTGITSSFTQLALNANEDYVFAWKPGDRIIIAMGCGGPGKIIHVARKEVVYADPFPDMRLSLFDLLPRWYPDWTPPPTWTWTYEKVKVPCPWGPHADRPAFLTWECIRCSRCTGGECWGALDIMTRKLGYAENGVGVTPDATGALAALNEIEDDQLLEEALI